MRVVLRTLAMTALMAGVAAPVAAQMPRAELSGIVGWNWSDGVEGDGVLAGDGNIYNEVGPADSFAWGLDLGFNVTEQVQVGFLFGQQMSTVEISGTAEREIGDFNVNTYHGYVSFNLTPPDAPVRPYFMFGLGATQYGSVDFTGPGGLTGTTEGDTQFSGTLGAGVKAYAGNVGVRLGAQWTPTYIKSDSVGWWCDPYWGCYVVGDAQYSNQFQISAGLVFRF